MKTIRNSWLWLALLCAVLALGCAGCTTTEADNASPRPWNSPEGWQGGALGGALGNRGGGY